MKINEGRVKEELVRMMMTQKMFAAKIGWSPQKLNYMIKRGRSFRTAYVLGKVLKVSPKVLMQ